MSGTRAGATIGITNAEFLEAMFADLPDEAAAMVCGFAGDPRTVRRGAWFARPWAFGSRLGDGRRLNTYVAVSSFRTDLLLGEYRRRKANFARLHAVMLDDLGDGPGSKLPMHHADRLPVSALIETSPANYQAWIFLEPGPETDARETCERLIDRMIDQGLAAASDPGMSGVCRLGRLPVGVNGKSKYLKDGRAFPVRMARWNPEFRYTVAQVAQAFGLDMTPPVVREFRRPPTVRQAHANIGNFEALLNELSEAGMYFGPLGEGRHSIICPWVHEHSDRSESGTAVMEPSEHNGWVGGFRCHHSHGNRLHIWHLYRFVREMAAGAQRGAA